MSDKPANLDTSTAISLSREDYRQALKSMGTVIDVSIDDLVRLTQRAAAFAQQRQTGTRCVATLMSAPVQVVRAHARLTDAADLLIRHRVSGLPVVDDGDKLVGIITEADFLRVLGVPSAHPSHSLWQTLASWIDHLDPVPHPCSAPVSQYMTAGPVTVSPGDAVQDVLRLMQRHHVKRVVVADDQRNIHGMVTRSDIVRAFFQRLMPPA